MSSAFQAVVRGASLTGLGKRPDLQPSHHALLLMGIKFRTWDKRRKPVVGIEAFIANAPLFGRYKNKTSLFALYSTKVLVGSLTEQRL
jgi:hypothetical protein